MKRLFNHIIRICLVTFIVSGLIKGQSNDRNITVHRFHEIDTLLSNPGKGWMVFQRVPRGTPRFPGSVGYWRFDWADLQPGPTTYNWAILDSSINAWKASGRKFSFRIETADPHTRGIYSSPKWLFDQGCRSFADTGGGDAVHGDKHLIRIEPDYSDPIFLSAHEKFIAELGKRYDGNPEIEFVDIGSYGLWGEWHTTHPVDLNTRKKIVDMYINAFKKTPLVMMTNDSEALAYAMSRGTGIRRDGIGSSWDIQSWSEMAKAPNSLINDEWKKAPVVFEWYGEYQYLKTCDHCSFDAGLKFMTDNHVTYINDNIGNAPDAVFSQLRVLGEKSGYRFVLKEISHPSTVNRAGSLNVHMVWENSGVAPIYRNYPIQLYLIDSVQNIIATMQVDGNVPSWLPGTHPIDATISVSQALKVGKYTIGVSMVDPITKKPAIRFPINAPDRNGIFYVSEVSVQ